MNTESRERRVAGYRRRFERWFPQHYHNKLTISGLEYSSITAEVAWQGYKAGADAYCHDATRYRALATTLIAQINGSALSPLQMAIAEMLHKEATNAGRGHPLTLHDMGHLLDEFMIVHGDPA